VKNETSSFPYTKNKTIALLIALIIVGTISGSVVGYSIGYGNGYQLGYSSGITEGNKVGIEEGQAIGYELGYSAGSNYGYNTGYTEGNSIGYQMGLVDGKQIGYTIGLNEGNKTGYLKGYNECWQSDLQITGYNIRDPTYLEVLTFIEADQTNNIPYDANSFNCNDFCAAVMNNAFKLGLRSFYVYITFKTTSHSVVAFNTTDIGIIFIETQYDQVVRVDVGSNYTTENGFVFDPNQVIIRYILIT
jgi:hypothetical protein